MFLMLKNQIKYQKDLKLYINELIYQAVGLVSPSLGAFYCLTFYYWAGAWV